MGFKPNICGGGIFMCEKTVDTTATTTTTTAATPVRPLILVLSGVSIIVFYHVTSSFQKLISDSHLRKRKKMVD